MSATFNEARNEILDLFWKAWEPTGHKVEWPNWPSTGKPKQDEVWARVRVAHSGGDNATLSGADGVKRYARVGTFFAQIFVPMGEGLEQADALAKIVADQFEGASTDHGVWFRENRIQEVGPSGVWFQVNFSTEFNYDEVK